MNNLKRNRLIKVSCAAITLIVLSGCVNWNYLFGRKAFFHEFTHKFRVTRSFPYVIDSVLTKRENLRDRRIKPKFSEFVKDYPRPKFIRTGPINNCYAEAAIPTGKKFRLLVLRHLHYAHMSEYTFEKYRLATYNDNGDVIDQFIFAARDKDYLQTGTITKDLAITIKTFKNSKLGYLYTFGSLVSTAAYQIDTLGHFIPQAQR
jgi:hypothetical protein